MWAGGRGGAWGGGKGQIEWEAWREEWQVLRRGVVRLWCAHTLRCAVRQ